MELLLFQLGDDRYGLAATSVREIARAVAITPLPQAPPVIEGVIGVRGAVVPVFDLRARFGLPPRPLSPGEHLVIASAGGRLVAMRVDSVLDLLAVTDDQVGAARGVSGAPVSRAAAGVATLDDGIVVIYDLDAFLSAAESEVLEGALATHAGA